MKPTEGAKQVTSQPGVAPPLSGPTVERGSRSSGTPTAEITPAADGRNERAGHPLRRLLTYLLRRRIIVDAATTLDPPLPPSFWQDKWTATAEANGFTRVRQGRRSDAPH